MGSVSCAIKVRLISSGDLAGEDDLMTVCPSGRPDVAGLACLDYFNTGQMSTPTRRYPCETADVRCDRRGLRPYPLKRLTESQLQDRREERKVQYPLSRKPAVVFHLVA
jgi:hypothetical protein